MNLSARPEMAPRSKLEPVPEIRTGIDSIVNIYYFHKSVKSYCFA